MKKKRVFFLIGVIIIALVVVCLVFMNTITRQMNVELLPPSHDHTTWDINTSSAYEALAVLNMLSGDPLAESIYYEVISSFEDKLTSEASKSITNIKAWKEQTGIMVTGVPTTYFSAIDPKSIDDLLKYSNDPELIKNILIENDESHSWAMPYYWTGDWGNFIDLLPDLKLALEWLRDIGFEEDWAMQYKPLLEQQADSLELDLRDYNVIKTVEEHIGFSLPSDEISITLSYYWKPRGTHLFGTRFVTETASFEPEYFVRTAVHEMMHPPFNRWDGRARNAILPAIEQNSFLMNYFNNREMKYGYNDVDYWVDENMIRALEQYISEKLGVARVLSDKWGKYEDGGMHSIAPVVYMLLRQENFPSKDVSFESFIIRMIDEGYFSEIESQGIYTDFFTNTPEPLDISL